jgi:hypothetical protein
MTLQFAALSAKNGYTMQMRSVSILLISIKWLVILLLIIIMAFTVYVYSPVMTFNDDDYLTRKGSLQNINITRHWQQNRSLYTEAKLLSSTGLTVEVLVRKPVENSETLPVVILLGGTGTGRNACGLISITPRVICASINYPYHGQHKIRGIDYLYNLRDIQHAIQDTPSVVLLLLDYLLRDSRADAKRVELIGVSFGAYLVSIPAVLDKRVTRVWIVQGSAEPVKVIRHNYTSEIKPEFVSKMVAHLLGWSLGTHNVDPQKWVGRLSPRPVVFINSKKDEALPHSSVIKLHAAAQQPSEVIWATGKHIKPTRQDVIEQLSNIVIRRIEQPN